MQRFGFSRLPIYGAVLACCSIISGLVPGGLQTATAQDATPAAGTTDPVLVVTVASFNKVMQDVNYMSGVLGQPQVGGMFSMLAGTFTQGLDTSRPLAVLVPMVDGTPEPIGVIPTDNVEAMLKRLEPQTGPVDKLDDGTLVVQAGPALAYIRQVGSWAVVARNRELIDLVPADPMPLMEGLGDAYDIGIRLNIQEIPLPLREMLVEQIGQGFEQAIARQPGGDDQLIDLSKSQLEQLNKVIRESDKVLFGININPAKRVVNIDTQFTAAAGTELAEMYAGTQSIPSLFASVLGGNAAAYYHAAASLSPAVIEASQTSIDALMGNLSQMLDNQEELGDDVKADIEELVGGLVDLVSDSLQEGKYDFGMISNADDNVLRLAGGTFVHSGDDVAKWVQNLDSKLRQLPDAPEFRFDESTYNGVTMHSVVIDIPAKADEARKLFGEQATIHLGTAPNAVYFAFGKGSVDMMKGLIDTADTDRGDVSGRPLGQMRVKLLPWLRLAQSIKANDSLAAVIDTVALSNDTDYVLLTGESIPNGQATYIEIGEGIIQAIGVAISEAQRVQMQQLQQGGGQF